MKQPKDLLGHISGGRVLDVATGAGGFIHFLLEGLLDYREITGIDTSERAAPAFAESFKDKAGIRFMAMDAVEMSFPDASFDTVSIANSLHHFEKPQLVLRQIARVLRPGGRLVLSEMYYDGQTETQMTHVHLHHWWAEVDRACGVVHNPTYRRDELVALLRMLEWSDLALHDHSDTRSDPKDPALLAELEPVFERYIQRAEGHPELQARGSALRQRVCDIGFHSAASLLAVAVK